ncbi:MAG: MFS transporter [Hyphomonadaceae bacterium]|nr:MFS transporter [Hyphomonadaceae bacterium]
MRIRRTFGGPVGRLTLVMSCVFAGMGVALPFLGRWLEEVHGLSGLEIAAVLSGAQLARFAVGPLIAAWADGFQDRRVALRVLSVAALALYVAFFNAQGFWALFVTSFLAQTMGQAMTPLVEGAILRGALVYGGLSYGVARGIGSLAFIVSNIAGGLLIARFGIEAVAAYILASMAAAMLSALFALAPDPVETGDGVGVRGRLKEALALFRRPAFALPVAAASLIQCGHSFYYGFSTLVWAKQGFSDALIGWLWAFGGIIEVALLWTLPRFERRFSPEALIAWGGAAAVLRWAAMSFLPPAALMWPLQALHALTFAATHVGALKLVQREAPPHIAGVAQTLYAALASGTLAGLSMLISGALYDSVGALGYLAMAALAAAGLAIMVRKIPSGRVSRDQSPPP